jgi:mRNA interferase MazF
MCSHADAGVSGSRAAREASTTGLARNSKAQAEQVRSIDVERIGALVASLDHDLMAKLDEALRLHLAL